MTLPGGQSRRPLSRRLCGVALLLTASVAGKATAATIRVPADQPSIQAAVDAAGVGDLILVSAGNYGESVSVAGKTDLRIEGEGGPEATSLLAPGHGPAFRITDCDNVVLSGFRISSELFDGDSGTVGGVILQRTTNAAVHHCIITEQSGNAILVLGATFEIWNVLTHGVGDDAVSLRTQSDLTSAGTVHHCTFADSVTGSAIGVWTFEDVDQVAVFNCIIHGNNYGLADGAGGDSLVHDFNLIGGNTVADYYGGLSRQPNEPDCDPAFLDRVGSDYHLTDLSCAVDAGASDFLGFPAASDDIDGQARPAGAGFDLGVDELGCALAGVGPTLWRACSGESVELDASGLTLPDCAGTVTGRWADDPTAPARRTVTPSATTSYVFELDCSSDADCVGRATYTVEIDEPPTLPLVTATDLAPCNTAILLEWTPSVFQEPIGAVYNVYRSELDCDEALAGLVAAGLTEPRWLDGDTVHGRSYSYVIEAEDGRSDGACSPQGAHHRGSAARSCVGPIAEVADAPLPEPVNAVLRASHDGQQLRLHWEASRLLLPNEHFHLLKAVDSPEETFSLASVEPSLALELIETDASSALQFFDLRAANECEQQSEDEYPRGWDR